jgi:transketolase
MMHSRQLPADWDKDIVTFPTDAKGQATRNSGGKVLNTFAKHIPWLVGGSADLAPSTKTILEFEGAGHFSSKDYGGRNFHFGIREHAMAAAVNGMTLSGLRGYGATFFVFADYCRPSLRLAAIMNLPSIFVFTHDSIGVGEDGPTHQPVEQLAAVRAIPNLVVIRPGDANESVYAWQAALKETHRPVAIILTRQNMPTLDREKFAPAEGLMCGGYVLSEAPGGKPDVILIATGSELSIAVAAQDELIKVGIKSRVVSLPSFELFEDQPQSYQDEVLPPDITARVAVEAGVRQGWDRYLLGRGAFVGMQGFGMSAPFEEIYRALGITPERVAAEARRALGK